MTLNSKYTSVSKVLAANTGLILMSLAVTETVVDLTGGRGVKTVAIEQLKPKKLRDFAA